MQGVSFDHINIVIQTTETRDDKLLIVGDLLLCTNYL